MERISTERNQKKPNTVPIALDRLSESSDYPSLPQHDIDLSDANRFRAVEAVNVPRSNFQCCQVSMLSSAGAVGQLSPVSPVI